VARIRTIKPQFFDSESMATLSPRARLLFIALTDGFDAMSDLHRQTMAHGLRADVVVMDPMVYCGYLFYPREHWRGPNGMRWREFIEAGGMQEFVDLVKAGRAKRQKRLKKQLRRRKKGWR